jgi:hypothetical protein
MGYDKIIYPIIMLSKTAQERKQTDSISEQSVGRGRRPKEEERTRRLRKCIDV